MGRTGLCRGLNGSWWLCRGPEWASENVDCLFKVGCPWSRWVEGAEADGAEG